MNAATEEESIVTHKRNIFLVSIKQRQNTPSYLYRSINVLTTRRSLPKQLLALLGILAHSFYYTESRSTKQTISNITSSWVNTVLQWKATKQEMAEALQLTLDGHSPATKRKCCSREKKLKVVNYWEWQQFLPNMQKVLEFKKSYNGYKARADPRQ